MDLFKRVGVEAIPFMTGLNENLRVAHEQGFGPTEDDVRRFQEYQREVAQLETKWDALVRKFKEGHRHHRLLGGQGRRLVPQQHRHGG